MDRPTERVEAWIAENQTGENRMTVRLLEYWQDLRGGRAIPSLDDFDIDAVGEFRQGTFILDLADGVGAPVFRFVGAALVADCGEDLTGRPLSSAPRSSLLARVADHYQKATVSMMPVRFTGTYVRTQGNQLLYRGVMMPFGKGRATVDYLVGAIGQRAQTGHVGEAPSGERPTAAAPAAAMATLARAHDPGEGARVTESATTALNTPATAHETAAGAPTPTSAASDEGPDRAPIPTASVASAPSRGVVVLHAAEAKIETAGRQPVPYSRPAAIGAAHHLAEGLRECRDMALAYEGSRARYHQSLYRLLERTYALYLEAMADRDAYAELLAAAGLEASDELPLEPLVKLVFGSDFDIERLTQFAAALSYAKRRRQSVHSIRAFLEFHEGGLEGCASAELAAPPAPRDDRTTRPAPRGRQMVKWSEACGAKGDLSAGDGELVVLLGRRSGDGDIEILRVMEEGPRRLGPPSDEPSD